MQYVQLNPFLNLDTLILWTDFSVPNDNHLIYIINPTFRQVVKSTLQKVMNPLLSFKNSYFSLRINKWHKVSLVMYSFIYT